MEEVRGFLSEALRLEVLSETERYPALRTGRASSICDICTRTNQLPRANFGTRQSRRDAGTGAVARYSGAGAAVRQMKWGRFDACKPTHRTRCSTPAM
jgi:hypothetical protein